MSDIESVCAICGLAHDSSHQDEIAQRHFINDPRGEYVHPAFWRAYQVRRLQWFDRQVEQVAARLDQLYVKGGNNLPRPGENDETRSWRASGRNLAL